MKILAKTKVKNGNQGKTNFVYTVEQFFSKDGRTKLLSSPRQLDQMGMLCFQGFWKP